MARRFTILDVFAERPLAGNQLAVVHDSDGLDGARMQAIAAEFGFSETVFLAPARNAAHSACVRIFTPKSELPFAGHPTVGAAVAVARQDGIEGLGQGIVVLEEGVGPVRCGVVFGEGRAEAQFDLPRLPEPTPLPAPREVIATALGLAPTEIGFENHEATAFEAGLPYTLVPVKNLAVAGRAAPVMAHWTDAFGPGPHACAYVYCRETVNHAAQFHARMFAPADGIPEDPATGSAVACFAGALTRFDAPVDGLHTVRVEQGVEMGRPSLITLELDIEDGTLAGGRIGGNVVTVASGELQL